MVTRSQLRRGKQSPNTVATHPGPDSPGPRSTASGVGEGLRSETDRPTLTKAEIFLALVDLAKEPTVRTKLVRKLTRPAGRRTAAAHGAGGSKRHKDANG